MALIDKYNRIELDKLPNNISSELKEMATDTSNFTDEDANAIFEDNFNELYKIIGSKYPDALKQKGKLKKAPKVKLKKVKEEKPEPKRKLKKVKEEKEKFTVELASVGNPDHSQNPDEPLYGAGPDKMVKVSSLKEAAEVCLKFISDGDLGGGNWVGGNVIDKEDNLVAHISYNGTIDEGNDIPKWATKRFYDKTPSVLKSKKSSKTKGDTVFTKDGIEVETGNNKYKGHVFYDEKGGKYTCLGYNEKLEDCVYMNEQTGKEVVGCMDGFYFNDPTKDKKDKPADEMDCDEAKETIKEAQEKRKMIRKKRAEAPKKKATTAVADKQVRSFSSILKTSQGKKADKSKLQRLSTKVVDAFKSEGFDTIAEGIKKGIEELLTKHFKG